MEGDRFVLDPITPGGAAAALQALASSSAAAQDSDSQEQASDDVDGSNWEEWLKYFVEADAAATTQEELKLQMQVGSTGQCSGITSTSGQCRTTH